MKYQAIIFDMDGTIIATDHIWNKATERFLESRTIQIQHEEKMALCEFMKGMALPDASRHLKTLFNVDDHEDLIMHEYSHYASSLYETEVKFIEGFLEFHATLDAHNLKYGVATNADDRTLITTKKALPLETLFGQHIYNITHVNFQGKPKPDIYLHAASQLGVDPQLCIAIEDSAHGVKAAKAANMLCIGINSHGSAHQLKEADIIINGYHEIDLTQLLGIQAVVIK
jgi:HAD superfamily hydrolase (TIGR01509 family)